jgi:hypothetical protein
LHHETSDNVKSFKVYISSLTHIYSLTRKNCNLYMKGLFLLLFLASTILASAQDLIIFRNGTQLECEIIKSDSTNVYYRFRKNERAIETFTAKYDIRSSRYNYNYKAEVVENNMDESAMVVIDTTQYVKESSQWINLLTYSPNFGINAKGWSLQYRGFLLSTTSKWTIPITFALDFQDINEELLYQAGYQGVSMSYYQAGISPIRKLNNYVYLNLGANLLYGTEYLVSNSYNESELSLFGLSTLQGLLIFPPSKFGFCIGLSVYQKLMTSQVYRYDLGVKLDVGIKF